MSVEAEVLFELTEEITGVTKEEILSGSRKSYIVDARKIISMSLYQNTDLTLGRIAVVVGRTNHATTLYHTRQHDNIMETDRDFRRNYNSINSKLVEYKSGAIPVELRLTYAINERKKISREIGNLRRLLKMKNEDA